MSFSDSEKLDKVLKEKFFEKYKKLRQIGQKLIEINKVSKSKNEIEELFKEFQKYFITLTKFYYDNKDLKEYYNYSKLYYNIIVDDIKK